MDTAFGALFLIVIILGIVLIVRRRKKAVADQFTDAGFQVDKKVVGGNAVLYVDSKNKKWAAKVGMSTKPKMYNFSDLNDFEIFEDGESIVQGRAGSALVGGLLFGGVGAIVGASRSKKVRSTCKSLQLRIRVNNINAPEIVIVFIGAETKKDSFIYTTNIESAKAMASTLSYIQNYEKKNVEADNQGSIEAKLKQLTKLRESGVITEQEYREKRKDLIGKW